MLKPHNKKLEDINGNTAFKAKPHPAILPSKFQMTERKLPGPVDSFINASSLPSSQVSVPQVVVQDHEQKVYCNFPMSKTEAHVENNSIGSGLVSSQQFDVYGQEHGTPVIHIKKKLGMPKMHGLAASNNTNSTGQGSNQSALSGLNSMVSGISNQMAI